MNIVNLSGGKDSMTMLTMMLDRGIQVDRILYADVGEGAEFPQMREYIARVEKHIGRCVETVKSDKHTARSMFYGYPSRGKYMDQIRGFPPTVGVGCRYRSWLKVDPLEDASGAGNDVFIGIAADEAHRSRAGEYAKGKQRYHFPLVEWGVTEAQCLAHTKKIGLYNSLYDHFDRLGCFWCPKQPLSSLRKLYLRFPDLWAELRQMEEDQRRPFKYGYPAYNLEVRFKRENALDDENRKINFGCEQLTMQGLTDVA